MNAKRTTWIVAILLNTFFVLISTPYLFGNTFFGDGVGAWVIYYVIGYLLSLYVTYAFLRCLKLLLNHTCEYFKKIDNGN